jgi:cyclophilin family peptidyl-prolyl cis-trans isomerase/HEAT repeat protein
MRSHRRSFVHWAPLFALSALAVGSGTSAPAHADEGGAPRVPPDLVTIATVEHARGDASALARFLEPSADATARRRAIVALGRLGARKGVADLLRKALVNPGEDRVLVLDAVALTREASLSKDVVAVLSHLPATDVEGLRAALRCLGDLGDLAAADLVTTHLSSKEPRVRAAAAAALGRMKADDRADLVAKVVSDPDAGVRFDAACAMWRLAAARKTAATKKDPKWDGDPAMLSLVPPSPSDDADTRMFLVRARALLLPKDLGAESKDEGVTLAASAADPRVQADAVSRVLRGRVGAAVIGALRSASESKDALVRDTVADVAGENGSKEAADVLRAMLAKEPDARVREGIAVGLARCGDPTGAQAILTRSDRPDDAGIRELTRARVLLAPDSPPELAPAICFARDAKTPNRAKAEILDGLKEKEKDATAPHTATRDLARELAKSDDAAVRESAVSLLGDSGGPGDVNDLASAYHGSPGRAFQDARIAAVKALAKIAGADTPKEVADVAAGVVEEALHDPSPFVRLAAQEGVQGWPAPRKREVPEDPHPNDWKGLPRPKAPVLGLDLTKGGAWLTEEEILRLAAEITRQRPRFVVENRGLGAFTMEVDAEKAPIHAVNLLLCAAAHVYDGTPWHRVVPAFVIQGGDPRGDGSGNAGYSVPDEITDLPYVRGALGMPKNTKDTGGCQLFVMHCAYPPLDRNYSCYGRVTSGMDVVDRIRVGDRIDTVRIEVPK